MGRGFLLKVKIFKSDKIHGIMQMPGVSIESLNPTWRYYFGANRSSSIVSQVSAHTKKISGKMYHVSYKIVSGGAHDNLNFWSLTRNTKLPGLPALWPPRKEFFFCFDLSFIGCATGYPIPTRTAKLWVSVPTFKERNPKVIYNSSLS